MQSGSRSQRTDLDEAGLCEIDVSGTARKEFQSAEFGDKRLTDRLVQVGDRLGRAPAESSPQTGVPVRGILPQSQAWPKSPTEESHGFSRAEDVN